MNSFNKINNVVGWLVFAITMAVYLYSVESTGSLWDCGEFISGAYKLQVVHPPGAPLFLMVGRVFTWIAGIFSTDHSNIAFAVNIMSAMCTAFGAMFICWSTIILGKLALVGRENEPTTSEFTALAGAGLVAGLSMAFATSVWFSAVEGEVYAMSTFFTCLTLWAMMKWYNAPDEPKSDKWIFFAVYSTGLSIGVHLLSLLTFPALALFYYFKKSKSPTILGGLSAAGIGVALIVGIQAVVIIGIPKLWSYLELFLVNSIGLPINYSVVILLIILLGVVYFGLKYAHNNKNVNIQNIVVGLSLLSIAFSIFGMVVIRANSNPPINMNDPRNPIKLLPYLNREQYGERPLLRGPLFNSRPIGTKEEDRYGQVGDAYEIVDKKMDYEYDPSSNVFFPRMGHIEPERVPYYKYWMKIPKEQQELPAGRPDAIDNLSYFFNYQIMWMYGRYFFWNFVGRQNQEQGFGPWNQADGNWLSGVKPIDELRLLPEKDLPWWMKNEASRNKYYFIPLIIGIMGLIYHWNKRNKDFYALMSLFIITGIGIIIYTNEPPNEPRERDYVIVGSIFTFAIWIGMGVISIYSFLSSRLKLSGALAGPLATIVALSAPVLMGTQNFDDHSRRNHYGSRDYAANFLNSCKPNAIIFTYGDNDTYPLWYAQEVEEIRTDIRVVNLSLIAVDWYIDQMRRKVNNSPAIKMSIPQSQLIGYKRNQVPVPMQIAKDKVMTIQDLVKFIGGENPIQAEQGNSYETHVPATHIVLPVDKALAIKNGVVDATDSIVSQMEFDITSSYLIKDDIAIMDIIANNYMERPIYFAVTCRDDKLQGLDNYMRLEGMATRLVPVKGQSEKELGVIGAGSVNEKLVYENVTKKFKWGNFDKMKTFINKSYRPNVQTTLYVVVRTMNALLRKGEKQKAAELGDVYLKGFPNMNFPYSNETMYIINGFIEAGASDKAKLHMKALADNMFEGLRYYKSLTENQRENGFSSDNRSSQYTVEQMINAAERMGDTQLKKDLETRFNGLRMERQTPTLN
jgi:Protein of unknown function (DUF2723)